MRAFFVFAIALMLTATAFAAMVFADDVVPTPPPATVKPYIFVLSNTKDAYVQGIAKGITETATAKKLSFEIRTVQSQGAAMPDEQSSLCNDATQGRPKIVVLMPLSTDIAHDCLYRGFLLHIAVGTIGGDYTVAMAKDDRIPLAFSVSSDDAKIGTTAANVIKSMVKTNTPKILVLSGSPTSNADQVRTAAFAGELRKDMPGAVIVGQSAPARDRLMGARITYEALNRAPNLSAVFAVNDAMALGAADAQRVFGQAQDLRIVGVDGTKAARISVIGGGIDATIGQLPYLIGKQAVELAVQAVAGKAPGKDVMIDTPLLTLQNLNENSNPNFKYLP